MTDLGTEEHVVQLGDDRRVEGGELARCLLDPRQGPAILAVDRLAFDVAQPNGLERQALAIASITDPGGLLLVVALDVPRQ